VKIKRLLRISITKNSKIEINIKNLQIFLYIVPVGMEKYISILFKKIKIHIWFMAKFD